MASSQTPGVVEDELICTEIVEKGGGGKTIFRTGHPSPQGGIAVESEIEMA